MMADIQGSGTTKRIAKFTASDEIGNSSLTDDSGNIGIGTTSPSDRLEVYGNGDNTTLKIHEDNENYEARLHLRSGSADWEIANYQGQLRWRYEGSELIRITPDGDVGIGETSPGEKLDVGGKVLISDSTSPVTPPSGAVTIYWDGTNLKAKRGSDGKTTVLSNSWV